MMVLSLVVSGPYDGFTTGSIRAIRSFFSLVVSGPCDGFTTNGIGAILRHYLC